MRRVRDVIRMKAAGLPSREIARRMGAAPSTVRLRFEAAGLSWPLPDELTDAALEARLFAKTANGNRQGHRHIAEPDWAAVHREFKRKHVTLSILWEEYIGAEPVMVAHWSIAPVSGFVHRQYIAGAKGAGPSSPLAVSETNVERDAVRFAGPGHTPMSSLYARLRNAAFAGA
ncbi:hypothetical protein ACVMAJ_001415 [Bradyrhizobium sp. USDA 4448]